MTKRMVGCAVLALAGLPAIVRAVEVSDAEGPESWAGLKRHPAVVNPVGRPADDPNVLSLRGTWDFKTARRKSFRSDEAPPTGGGYFWDPNDKPSDAGTIRSIQVPSCWELQGVGDSGTSTPCLVRWDVSPKPLRHGYVNEGWYRKRVTIPVGWKNRRIWLKTGWVNSQGCFWVNGHPVAWDDSYCGTYKYDVTDYVKPGEEACVVVQVMNYLPSRRGTFNSVHRWGGIIRDIEFEATPEVFIDDAWVRGDFDRQEAEVHVAIEGKREEVKGKRLRVTVEDETVEVCLDNQTIKQSNNQTILKVPLRNFKAWSPEHPNLYWAKIELVRDGEVVQTWMERFGVRKLEVRGSEVYLNGSPFFFRGAGWHFVHPLEGAPLPDRETWLKKAKVVRAAGFNFVRTHTMCNMPEFFEACDEVGLMVQPELPYYTDIPRDAQTFNPLGEARELYEHFRRYPSFAVYCGGNEGRFGEILDERLYRTIKGRDPDRLMMGQDAWPSAQFNRPGCSDFVGGPMSAWPRGCYCPDRPFICHEYLNLCVKLDSRLEGGYTGVYLPTVSRAKRAEWLERFGLDLDWGDRLQDAQNAMQGVWRKYGIEMARTDPHCDGYSFWSLQDCASPQKGTYSGQALFDPFWGTKSGGESPADVAVYNSPSCVTITDAADPVLYEKDPRGKKPGWSKMFCDAIATNRVRVAGESLRLRVSLAHYGERPLVDAKLVWKLTAGGRVLASGEQSVGDQPLGPARVLGEIAIDVPDLAEAVRAELLVSVESRQSPSVANAWPFWLFPRRTRPEASGLACAEEYYAALSPRYANLRREAEWEAARTVIAPFGSDLEKRALAAGKNVVALANQTGPATIFLGWWWMGDQMGAALKKHSALAGFPHGSVFGPLFFRIGKTGLKLPIAGVRKEDIVMAGEGGDACYLYIADVPQADGAHRIVIAGLDVLSETAEGMALLDGFAMKGMRR